MKQKKEAQIRAAHKEAQDDAQASARREAQAPKPPKQNGPAASPREQAGEQASGPEPRKARATGQARKETQEAAPKATRPVTPGDTRIPPPPPNSEI